MQSEEQLEEFRTRWREELQQSQSQSQSKGKGRQQTANSNDGEPQSGQAAVQGAALDSEAASKADLFRREPVATATTATTTGNEQQPPSSAASRSSAVTAAAETAVSLYAKAVQAEREGRMNDALSAYRAAFRKDDNVDKLYHRMQQLTPDDPSLTAGAASGDRDPGSADDDLAFRYQRTLHLEPDYERQKQLKRRMLTASYVESLLKSFRENPYIPEAERKEQRLLQEQQGATDEVVPSSSSIRDSEPAHSEDAPLTFQPRNINKPLHISKLPDELLLHVLSFLTAPSPNARSPDMRSFERGFSLVSRKARILTLQSANSLWKSSCLSTYTSPLQIEPSSSVPQICERSYANDWRLMWIEQPRIRTDGVYISQITYIRKGAHELGNTLSYFDPTHAVTYYRYLVFLPSGDVVSLLSHDIPSVIVPNLLSTSSARSVGASTTHAAKHASSSSSSSSSSSGLGAGYTVGRWRLIHVPATSASSSSSSSASTTTSGSTIVQLSSLEDPRLRSSDVKYSFRMICRLKSTTRGKNNKLEMINLVARNHRTGEEGDIPMKSGAASAGNGMPSFYFSRVLSYD